MPDQDPPAPHDDTLLAYYIPAQMQISVGYDIHACPTNEDHQVELELTGAVGTVGLALTARQAADLASQLSLAAHTTDDATDQ